MSMRILVMSDLHLEVWRDAADDAQSLAKTLLKNLSSSSPDAVVMAGDIDLGDRAVAWAHAAFPGIPVVYVHGNHEAYGDKLERAKERLAIACAATDHVHLLDRSAVVIAGVRFLGATLWTDFQLLGRDRYQEALQAAGADMNDYRKIRLATGGYRKLRPLDTVRLHVGDRLWLQEKLVEPFQGATVVVTHMAPSEHSIHERYRGQLSSTAFASNLDALVEKSDLWIHGHVHDSPDYRIGNTRIVSKPMGYPVRLRDGTRQRKILGSIPGCSSKSSSTVLMT